jgi:sec-independent protein translocase protein TatA
VSLPFVRGQPLTLNQARPTNFPKTQAFSEAIGLRAWASLLGLSSGFSIWGVFMFGELGLPEILLVLGIALLLFGPKKIGEVGKSLGEGIRGFRKAVSQSSDNNKEVS